MGTTHAIHTAENDMYRRIAERDRRDQWLRDHPDIGHRLEHVEHALDINRTEQRLSHVREAEHTLGTEL